jgi:hypothetical protein
MNDTTGEVEKVIPSGGGGGQPWTPPKTGTKGKTGTSPNKWAGTIRCAVDRHQSRSVVVTCDVSKAASKAFRSQKIAVLLHRDGRLTATGTGHFGRKIEIHGRFKGRYTLAIDYAGNVKVVRALKVA